MKVISKTYVDNSRFMEFIDEMATQITEMNFGADTWSCYRKYGGDFKMKDDAQEFYNEMYDDYEMMVNNMLGVYSDNDEKK